MCAIWLKFVNSFYLRRWSGGIERKMYHHLMRISAVWHTFPTLCHGILSIFGAMGCNIKRTVHKWVWLRLIYFTIKVCDPLTPFQPLSNNLVHVHSWHFFLFKYDIDPTFESQGSVNGRSPETTALSFVHCWSEANGCRGWSSEIYLRQYYYPHTQVYF